MHACEGSGGTGACGGRPVPLWANKALPREWPEELQCMRHCGNAARHSIAIAFLGGVHRQRALALAARANRKAETRGWRSLVACRLGQRQRPGGVTAANGNRTSSMLFGTGGFGGSSRTGCNERAECRPSASPRPDGGKRTALAGARNVPAMLSQTGRMRAAHLHDFGRLMRDDRVGRIAGAVGRSVRLVSRCAAQHRAHATGQPQRTELQQRAGGQWGRSRQAMLSRPPGT